MVLGADSEHRQLRRGDGGQSMPCDRDQHVQREQGTTTHINITHCVHTVALNGLTILMLDPSQQVRTLYAWKGGGRKEHASMRRLGC